MTISRQMGSGGQIVFEELRAFLDKHLPLSQCSWTVFDRNLVESVLKDHRLPQRLARYMPEDKVSAIGDMVEEVLGLHPPSWTLVRKTTETILHLAEMGGVILVGRAANIITRRIDTGVHVRLVGSLDRRIAHAQEYYHLSAAKARDFVCTEDRSRRSYFKRYFKADIDDPLLYHAVINTDLVPYERAARLIGEAVVARIRG